MTGNKITKKNLIYRSIFVVFSAVILVFVWNHFFNKPNSPATKSNNKETITTTIKTTSKAPKEPINVLSIGIPPFKSDDYAKFQETSIEKLLKLNKPSFIIINKDYMKSENEKLFIDLAKKHHTVLFYGEEIEAEGVVSYLNGIVPVVPIESSNPLKFQAYGVTTLDDNLIPIFVSVTTDQKDLNEKSFKEAIKQVAEKTN